MTSPGQAARGAAWGFLLRGSLGYVRSWTRNIVKAALGRKPYFTPHDVLFRAWLRQLCGGPKLGRITSDASTDEGAGSQALMTMRAIDFARRAGLTYVHTPFSHIHHADRPMPAWADAWERHFNLGEGEVRNDGSDQDTVNYAFTFPALHALFGLEEDEPAFDDATIREFRRRYYVNKSPRRNEILSVCVHARRRNRHDFHAEDSTDLSKLGRILARLRAALEAQGIDYSLRVFSQGQADEFRALDVPASALFLDADPLWSMQEMIEADILVTALGTFSYVAGLLCDGVVLGDAAGPPARGWIVYDANGDFDSGALGLAVTSLPSTSVR
ncbi:MAG: hypothetical protein Q8N31_16610 [Reyranella sp.]|nr:hypothetical protein [Reyranella sp.]MDP3161638.1 hypothetical protein [Reyranella sp.]